MQRNPDFRLFDLVPITGALGADITGADLTRPDHIAETQRALDIYRVVAIRDQKLDPAKLHAVARRFGPFSGNPVHQPIDGYDDIVRFAREPDDTGMVAGENWHMDLAWLEKPPGITMLYGEVIPPVGGDTCFASLEHTYKALSPGMKALLDDLVGIHSGKGVFAINAGTTRLGLRRDAAGVDDIEVEHPVVCVHPATGRRYLFISSVLARFKGMTEAESKPIVDYLIGIATRPENTCRVRWQPGTLTMWANPYVLHTAINDYSSHRRVTYRTTIEGPVPQAARGNDRTATRAA